MEEIFAALRDVAGRYKDVDVVYPVHPNPHVDGPARKALSGAAGVHLIPPLEYKAFCDLMAASHLILTDSGGSRRRRPP